MPTQPDEASDLDVMRTQRHDAGLNLLLSVPSVLIGLGAWAALRKQVRRMEALEEKRELEAKEAAAEVIDVDSRPSEPPPEDG